jgi:hypothetical protein
MRDRVYRLRGVGLGVVLTFLLQAMCAAPAQAIVPQWETTGALGTSRAYHAAALLPNGKVLVAGGYNGTYLSTAELYDPASGVWSATGSMASSRAVGPTAALLLPNGKILVAGVTAALTFPLQSCTIRNRAPGHIRVRC